MHQAGARMRRCSGEWLARGLPLLKVTPSSNKGIFMIKVSNVFIAGAAAALLPLAAAMAQQTPPAQDPTAQDQPAQPAQQSRGTSFESLDTNSDGKISKAEAEANPTVKAQFSSYDQNGDGFIERDEVSSSNKSRSESPQQ
jgi:hypothetical protein